ncbi:MAG: sigma-E factor negative regulatory protein, partial [Nitrosomonas sp.]|nr:sigma-E factor negative regulatory protein [Nitrosomonas sp.]
MKSKVSALMDGELDKQDALNVIEAVRRKDELQEEWECYHLIGDALRQSSRLSMNISFSVSQKLKTEPTVLFPNTT